ncbi:MAG: DMT family transporter [Planctomycetota bacterium]|jgi:drug/metabolite transporter (DMT)-like permease
MDLTKARKFDVFATLASIAALLCWTTGPIFIKVLTGYLDVWTQNVLRYAVAALFWLPYLLLAVKKGRVAKRLWLWALLPAAANTVMQSLWAGSFYYLNPAFMILLAESSLIWIAGFSIIFFAQERPLAKSKLFWLAVLLSVTGVIGVLLFEHDFAAAKTLTGIALALAGAFMWAVYTICAKVAFKNTDSRTGFSVVSIYTLIGLAILAMVFGRPGQCLNMDAWPWACVVISALFSIAFSHVLYYFAIKRIGATVPALVLLALPFIIFAISSIVFDESLSPFQIIFGIILIIGSAFAILAQRHLRPAQTVEGRPGGDP